MSKGTLRIAYLCDMSPLDRNLYSGGNARIYDALRRHAGEVTVLSQGWHGAEPLRRLIHAMPESVNLRLRWRAHLALSRIIARGVRAELAQGDYDVLFCAYSLHSLAGLRAPDGMVTCFTSDATQTTYRNSEIGAAFQRRFPGGALLDNWIEAHEARALRACDLLLWPSDWLRQAAQRRYALPPARAHLLPWGANMDWVPAPAPKGLTPGQPLNLLVIGRDWFAKGGPIAFDTMQALRDQGVDARLTVIGCTPPEFHRNDHVTVHPQLDKSRPEDLALFNAALEAAHFLIQPSYESYGFAFCEAAALGLPALCLRVGGVPVREGVNGHALPPDSGPRAFADLIQTYLQAPARYAALSQSARQEYEDQLNWYAWGARAATLLQQAVAQKQGD